MRFYFACVMAGQNVVSEVPDRDEWHRQRGTSIIWGNTRDHQELADLLRNTTSVTVIRFGDGTSVAS